MVIISVAFIILVLFSIDYKSLKALSDTNGFDIESTNCLKGILAIMVIYCHLVRHCDYSIPYLSFSLLGNAAVGMFFLLSGYGLYVSMTKKPKDEYFNKFLYRHYVKLTVPVIIMAIIYYCLFFIIHELTVESAIDELRSFVPINHSWFFVAISYCYLLFYIGFKKMHKFSHSIIFIALGIVPYMAFYIKFVSSQTYLYKTIPFFVVGIIFARFKDRIIPFINKHYFVNLIISLIIFGVLYLSPAFLLRLHIDPIIDMSTLNSILATIGFCLLCCVYMCRGRFKSKLSKSIYKISYEIYIFHGIALRFLASDFVGYPLDTHLQQEMFCILGVILSILFSFVMNKLITKITNKILKK